MAGCGLSGLDWQAPWYSAWAQPGQRVAASVHAGVPLHEALSQEKAPVRFVPQAALPADEPYEQFIARTASCPVREGLHDFFNGLCWIAFPQAKRAFNRLQAAEIARDGIGERRGAVRDAVTVFDENGALLHAPAPLWQALLAREWNRLFIELRPLWGQARLVVFGHAMLEKLAQPRKDLTAHVWCADAPAAGGELDGWLGGQISAAALARKPFTPLPLLGVPGWWAPNAGLSFYDDPLVFRPRRVPTSTTTPQAPADAPHP